MVTLMTIQGSALNKKGIPVHVAPAYAGSREGTDHFGSFVRSLSLHFCKRLFLGLELMTSWHKAARQQLYHCSPYSD